jgi:hypothetical protein
MDGGSNKTVSEIAAAQRTQQRRQGRTRRARFV